MTILDQSLCLLDGVSPEAEVRLRRMGVVSCSQLARAAERYFSASHAERVRKSFDEMLKANACNLADWFVSHLPVGHRVRALQPFLPDVTFYDIETDGMGPSARITCISTLRYGRFQTFVQGKNLQDFLEIWSSTRILVGFNSKRFDTPFVCNTFGLSSSPAQVDLMEEASCYGLRNGLKSIERFIGFKRKTRVCNDGFSAIRTWNKYKETGANDILETLLEYNRDDVRSLYFLSKKLLELSLENTQIY